MPVRAACYCPTQPSHLARRPRPLVPAGAARQHRGMQDTNDQERAVRIEAIEDRVLASQRANTTNHRGLATPQLFVRFWVCARKFSSGLALRSSGYGAERLRWPPSDETCSYQSTAITMAVATSAFRPSPGTSSMNGRSKHRRYPLLPPVCETQDRPVTLSTHCIWLAWLRHAYESSRARVCAAQLSPSSPPLWLKFDQTAAIVGTGWPSTVTSYSTGPPFGEFQRSCRMS